MASNSQDPSRQAAAHGQGPSGDWRQERVGSPVEGRRVIQAVLSAMTGQGNNTYLVAGVGGSATLIDADVQLVIRRHPDYG